MSQPTPLSLVFGPEFGAPHRHPDGRVVYYRDRMAGHIRVFKPVIPGIAAPRTIFEIGRHQSCWVRIGWESGPSGERQRTNEDGYPLFGAISRKQVTFAWASETDYPWLSTSKWLVMPGGVFVGKDGQRESSGARNGVWLNGIRLHDGDNPEPLFGPGQREAKISLGLTGRIIVIDELLGEHSTSWPSTIWLGGPANGWPPEEPSDDTGPGTTPQRQAIEGQIAEAHGEVTGRTMADVLAIVLVGPEGIDRRLWWAFCGVVAAGVLWAWER